MQDSSEYSATTMPLPTNTLVDSVLILLAMNVVQRLVGFVRAVLFCRWLNAEQLGMWDMAFSLLVLASPITVLAIPGSFGRYLEHFRQRGQMHLFLRRMILACGGLGILGSLALVLLRRPFAVLVFGSVEQANLIALAAGTLALVVAYNFMIELFTAARNIRLVSGMQLINSAAFAVLGVAMLLTWECTAGAVLAAYAGACLVTVAWGARPLGRLWRAVPHDAAPLPHAAMWNRIGPFAAWVLLGCILTNAFAVVDRYMIVHFSSTTASAALDIVGNYHASRVVPLLLISIASMLATMSMPHLSHDWEAGRRDLVAARLRLFLKVFGVALFAAAVAVQVAGPLLFQIAFKGKFPEGQAVLPWALVFCTWFGLSLFAQNYLLCAERAGLVGAALAAGLGLNVLLNIELLPRFGLHGAVLSTTAANALTLLMICWFNRRHGFRLDRGAMLVLVLPVAIWFGPWASAAALLIVCFDAAWGRILLSGEERRQLAEGAADYARRFGWDGLSRRFSRRQV